MAEPKYKCGLIQLLGCASQPLPVLASGAPSQQPPSGSISSPWIRGSEEGKARVCLVSLIPHLAQGSAQSGVSVDGQVENWAASSEAAEPCQLGLSQRRACLCGTAALIADMQFTEGLQLLSSLAQRPKAPGLAKQGGKGWPTPKGGCFLGNAVLNPADIRCLWLGRRAM